MKPILMAIFVCIGMMSTTGYGAADLAKESKSEFVSVAELEMPADQAYIITASADFDAVLPGAVTVTIQSVAITLDAPGAIEQPLYLHDDGGGGDLNSNYRWYQSSKQAATSNRNKTPIKQRYKYHYAVFMCNGRPTYS